MLFTLRIAGRPMRATHASACPSRLQHTFHRVSRLPRAAFCLRALRAAATRRAFFALPCASWYRCYACMLLLHLTPAFSRATRLHAHTPRTLHFAAWCLTCTHTCLLPLRAARCAPARQPPKHWPIPTTTPSYEEEERTSARTLHTYKQVTLPAAVARTCRTSACCGEGRRGYSPD